MSNILIYPRDRRSDRSTQQAPGTHRATHIDTYKEAHLACAGEDPLFGLGWLIAAVGLLCMLSAIALATLNLA